MHHRTTRILEAFIAIHLITAGAAAEESITVDVVGRIQTGLAAIGGETTGTTISAKGITWELEFGKNAKFRETAKKLSGKQARVKGSLERRKGVEIRDRWIVTVTNLQAAPPVKSKLDAKTRRETSKVTFKETEGATLIDVTSPFGIDHAVITRGNHRWPANLTVRLHLKGLESFKVAADQKND